jgi:hypothetical protein
VVGPGRVELTAAMGTTSAVMGLVLGQDRPQMPPTICASGRPTASPADPQPPWATEEEPVTGPCWRLREIRKAYRRQPVPDVAGLAVTPADVTEENETGHQPS